MTRWSLEWVILLLLLLIKNVFRVTFNRNCYKGTDSIEAAIEDHDRNLESLLQRAREKNLKFNRDKLLLRMPSVTYMGHVLSSSGVSADPAKKDAILP